MEYERRQVWENQPVPTPRMPDPVREAAVRAVLIGSVALVETVVSLLLAVGHSWLSAPMTLLTVLTSVLAAWAVLDVWVTRQVWNQRDGVVSSPSSAARALRRERRRARRQHRTRARAERRTGPRNDRRVGERGGERAGERVTERGGPRPGQRADVRAEAPGLEARGPRLPRAHGA